MAIAKDTRRNRRNESDAVVQQQPRTVVTAQGELKRETGSRPKSEAELNDWLWDNEDTPVGRELQNEYTPLLYAGPETGWKQRVDKDRVKDAAKSFVEESQDFSYSKRYRLDQIKDQAQENGVEVRDYAHAEELYNQEYATKADAILFAAKLGNVKLTEPQQRRLEAAREGKMSDMQWESTAAVNQRIRKRDAVRRGLSGGQLEQARENFYRNTGRYHAKYNPNERIA